MKRFPWVLAVALGVVGLSALGRGFAQAPSAFEGRPMAPPQGFVPATPPGTPQTARAPHPFEVTAQAGPWMVLAATYTSPQGTPDAVYMAEQVVRHLRANKYNAYLWNFSDQKRRQEEEEYNRMMQANPDRPYRRRITRMHEQCGVLVGGYRDSETANKVMQAVKVLPAPVVRNRYGAEVSDEIVRPNQGASARPTGFASNFTSTDLMGIDRLKREKISPFVRAFVIRNPALPHQQPDQTAKVDPFWKELNHGRPYNLLKCRKDWTLVIKVYEGAGMLQSAGTTPTKGNGFLDMLGIGGKSHQILDATATEAEAMAKCLRENHYEAYVLHTRGASILTVGGYDSPEDEQLRRMQQDLSRLRFTVTKGPQVEHNSLELFAQPLPMRIPRL
jgi:hypothetical protein